jgi:hypothetical protein
VLAHWPICHILVLGCPLAAGLGWGWSIVFAATAGACPWSPPTVSAFLVAVAGWELAPFAGLRFLTHVAMFEVLKDLSALSPLFNFAILPLQCCLSKIKLILGFCWAKLVGFLPLRLPKPVAAPGKPSSTILGSTFLSLSWWQP